MPSLTDTVIAGLEYTIRMLRGEVAEERRARIAAEEQGRADREAIAKLQAMGAMARYDARRVWSQSLAATMSRGLGPTPAARFQQENQHRPGGHVMVDPDHAAEMNRIARGNYGHDDGPTQDARQGDNPGRAVLADLLRRRGE